MHSSHRSLILFLGVFFVLLGMPAAGNAACSVGGGATDPGGGANLPPLDVPVAPGERDVFKQPFASTSIWNMPIGSAAQYVPINFTMVEPGNTRDYTTIWVDPEIIVISPDSPQVNAVKGPWPGGNGQRCTPTSSEIVERNLPLPVGWIRPSDNQNGSSAVLAADRRWVINLQPLTRCTANGPVTSLASFGRTDIYGDGIRGAHGGSGMSAFGGSLRVGEMRPGQDPPRHALKLTWDLALNGYNPSVRAMYPGTSGGCYRWPAAGCDRTALDGPGGSPPGYGTYAVSPKPPGLVMGALLAIKPEETPVSLGLETEPGRMLLWTLQNYGVYLVDESNHGPATGDSPNGIGGYLFGAEDGPHGVFTEQFDRDWGASTGGWGNKRIRGNTAWIRDVMRMLKALHVIENNSPSSIGGGGTPRQLLAPAVYPP